MNDEKLKRVQERLNKEKEELISLLPRNFQSEFRDRSYIGGGAIYSLYNDEEPKDFDFFVDDEEFAKEVYKHFKLHLAFHGREKVGTYRGLRLVVTDNSVSIGRKFQIVIRWAGVPEDVVEEFDFCHNQFYYYKGDIDTLSQWDFLEDRRLRYNENRARDICGTIIRVKKFVERGFTITNKEMAKMLLKLNEVGFNEREVEILEHAGGDFES